MNRKRRPRPPWGGVLGGKPVNHSVWNLNYSKKIALRENDVRGMQYLKMLRLKQYYNITGGDFEFPIKGVGAAEWLPWYELALAIASELDDSLKIADAPPPGKTARRWRGDQGKLLLDLVAVCQRLQPKPKGSVRWCLKRVKTSYPDFFGNIPLDQLEARYYDAKRHHGTTKAVPNKERAS